MECLIWEQTQQTKTVGAICTGRIEDEVNEYSVGRVLGVRRFELEQGSCSGIDGQTEVVEFDDIETNHLATHVLIETTPRVSI